MYIYIQYTHHLISFKPLSNSINYIYIYTDWWFGTFLIFPYIGNFIIPTDYFSEGWINHQPIYIGKNMIQPMVVYLPTKLDVWGKCWDSCSNTMVRIWGSSTTNQINYLYMYIYIYILVAHPTARKWVITPVIYMG